MNKASTYRPIREKAVKSTGPLSWVRIHRVLDDGFDESSTTVSWVHRDHWTWVRVHRVLDDGFDVSSTNASWAHRVHCPGFGYTESSTMG